MAYLVLHPVVGDEWNGLPGLVAVEGDGLVRHVARLGDNGGGVHLHPARLQQHLLHPADQTLPSLQHTDCNVKILGLELSLGFDKPRHAADSVYADPEPDQVGSASFAGSRSGSGSVSFAIQSFFQNISKYCTQY
jgi:hypothetical protein